MLTSVDLTLCCKELIDQKKLSVHVQNTSYFYLYSHIIIENDH